MTITLAYDSKPKATRTETLRLVPSQFTERIQAGPVPAIWPGRESLVVRVTEYYFSHRWPAAVMFAFGLVVAAGAIAAWIVTL